MNPCHSIRALASTSAILTVMLFAVPARAGVPSSANSSLPACMALCPFGDAPFSVVVRDIANNPVAGSSVVLDFSSCPGAYLCTIGGEPDAIVDLPSRTVRGITNVSGNATLHAHVGGTGPAGSVRVFADGVLLQSYALASPDQDGDGFVVSIIGPDDAIFAAKLGTTNPTADFDCSGLVDFMDEQFFYAHHSQSCNSYVDPVRRSTWGAVKLHYR